MSGSSPPAGSRDSHPRPMELLLRPIPSTGERIPAMGLGTWQAFDVAGDRSETARAGAALEALVQGGGTLVDSSPMYGSAESVVGELAAARKLHERLFLATKVWTSGREAGLRQMETSARRMRAGGKGGLDLIQVHNLVDVDTHLATLRAWKREGRIRYLGVTHYSASAHAALARVIRPGGIDFLQVNYSVAEPGADTDLLAVAQSTGTAVIVNRPFAEGAMFRRARGKPLPAFAAELGAGSWAQLFLKWILAHPAVTCVIPGTRNADHVRENLAGARGPLPDAAMRKRICAAFQAL